MRQREMLDLLLETAEKVYDRVESGQGDFRGGECEVRGERYLVINRSAGVENNLRIVATALARHDTDHLYLRPALREVIERYREE